MNRRTPGRRFTNDEEWGQGIPMMPPFPCIATNTSPPLERDATKIEKKNEREQPLVFKPGIHDRPGGMSYFSPWFLNQTFLKMPRNACT